MKTAAKFEIPFVQYLDPKGKPTQDLPKSASKDELLKLYKMMSKVRIFDTKAIALQRTGKLGTYASSLGHEAAHVGIGTAMIEEDAFCPMYREYGAQFVRGVKMSEVLLYWGGDERGSNFSGPKHDFPWCVPIATQYLHAAGSAMAFKYRGEKRAAVTVIGDGGTSEGDFYEALNAAGAWKLPFVGVTVNNKWAISVPLSKQTACETLAQKGIAGGMDVVQVDGNDIIAVREVMEQALKKARNGEGPTFVEMLTYRLHDHTTADDARRYRPDEEVEAEREKEPLIRLRQYINDQGWWDEDQEKALVEELKAEVDAAVEEYQSIEPPGVEDMFDYHYEEITDPLAEQREVAIKEARRNA
ncbi:pyruvate dehydrogenase E1 component alpha subunit [Natronospira proteinivora]|uniref:Pyruvate dehydrogenase E1 component subunit alpha n=1 Tax=Natronospira proteinivora TaxID=1807133 RepID=A0ABT1G876_9GAMM|nr:pyruvate dehydrogenase E1 component alpha subunit [Natronospira proteinivora]